MLIEETGQSHDSNVVSLIFACVKGIKKFADFAATNPTDEVGTSSFVADSAPEKAGSTVSFPFVQTSTQGVGLNHSYTINLNLPATSDISVFNAIFKSLKENLLRGSNEQ